MNGTLPSATACFQRAWDVMSKNLGLAVGVSALNLLVSSAASSTFFGIAVYGPLRGGLARFCLKLVRGEAATVNDAFSGFSIQLVPLVVGGLISVFGLSIGFMLCLLPGIYLAFAWMFAETLIIEKNMDFWPALELSRQTFHQNAGFVITLGLLQMAVLFAGSLACGIGVFAAYPLVVLANAVAYDALFGGAPAQLSGQAAVSATP